MEQYMTADNIDLINTGSMVVTTTGNHYLHLPFWYKATNDPHVYEVIFPDKLPEELTSVIKASRDYPAPLDKEMD